MDISGREIHSPTYNRILAFTETKPLNTGTKWEQDLDCTFEDSEWESLCKDALTFSYNSHHKLLQFNIIHRTTKTPQDKSISDLCPKCKTETGNLIHMFWECNKLKHYWGSILEILKEIIGSEIPCSPKLALLGDISDIPFARRNKVRFIKSAMIAGNKCLHVA